MTILTRLCVILSLCVCAAAPAQQDYDQWYVLEMLGARSGYMHNAQVTKDDMIETSSIMRMSIKRGTMTIEIEMDQTWVETLEGKPVSIMSRQKLGAQPAVREYTFKGDELEVVTRTGEQVVRTTTSVPEGDWVTPAVASRMFMEKLEAGETSIDMTLLQPDIAGLTVITSTYADITETTVEVLGKTVPAYRATVTSDQHPAIQAQTFFNRQGVPLRDEIDMGVASLTTIAADRALALSKLDPPELMAQTFVSPTGRYAGDPRRIRRASYLLSMDEGSLPVLPSAGAQHVEVLNERTARVVVDLDNPLPAEGVDPARFLEPSSLVDSSDKRIIALTKKAVHEAGEDQAARAEAIRRFVFDYVEEKDLGVGFATASEVCLTRAGDCSEHGVLLAAMLRADGIPSRTVSGVLYVDEFLGERRIFGYHMWAQALLEVDGELTWVDLDGTFPHALPTDATHIALGASAMSDDEAFDGLIGLVPLMGRLKIEIEQR